MYRASLEGASFAAVVDATRLCPIFSVNRSGFTIHRRGCCPYGTNITLYYCTTCTKITYDSCTRWAMRRSLLQTLTEWRSDKRRLPLLLRGARQVGKTYLVNDFAKQHFKNTVVINFEKRPEYAKCFTTLEPRDIIQKISAYVGEAILPGETLLFLDEIQVCPHAIQALRYFKEDMPLLHVIGAGSLLEFALSAGDFKMPVGRVQYLYLKPLSFIEYLNASGKETWIAEIKKATITHPVPEILHDALLKEIKIYMALGGMPAVVDQYINDGAGEAFQRTQMGILETYADDFAKYASMAKQVHIQTVFDQLPSLIGQQTKYNKINPDVHSRFLKEAIHCLQLAGVVYRIYATAASGLPLNSLLNFHKYKLFFLDVGLISAKSGLSAEILTKKDIFMVNRGEIAEQFVCQELLAYQSCFQNAELQYWSREQKNSQAEVDFVIQSNTKIIPIEVKAGSTGKLKSLQIMMQEKKIPVGVRVSQLPLQLDDSRNIISIPFYMVSEMTRLVNT